MQYGYSAHITAANKAADVKKLGVKLGRVCIKQGVSVAECAKRFSVTRQTIYNWFTGVKSPSKVHVVSVEKFLARFKDKAKK